MNWLPSIDVSFENKRRLLSLVNCIGLAVLLMQDTLLGYLKDLVMYEIEEQRKGRTG